MGLTDEQGKLLLAYIQCVDGKADWTKMATMMGLSSGAAAQARFTRLQTAYKNTDVKVGDGHAKNGRGPTALKPAAPRVTKQTGGKTRKAKRGGGETQVKDAEVEGHGEDDYRSVKREETLESAETVSGE